MPLGFAKNSLIAASALVEDDDEAGFSSGEVQGELLYTLNNPNDFGAAFDQFGQDIQFSPSGQYLAVGALYADSSSANSTGAIYLYDMTDGSKLWGVEGPAASDLSGTDVSITDNYVYVGIPNRDVSGSSNAGEVRVYDITDGSLHATVNAPTVGGNYYFGQMVAANPDDDGFVVYERGTNKLHFYNSSGTLEGSVSSVFSQSASGNADLNASGSLIVASYSNGDNAKTYKWSRSANGELTKPSGYNLWGRSNAVDDSLIVIGDPGHNSNVGRVTIYDTVVRSIQRSITNPGASNEGFASFRHCVSIWGNYLIVGAWLGDNGFSNDGKAYLLDSSDGSTLQTHTSDNKQNAGYYGYSTAASQWRYAVGAYGENSNQGRVYVYSTGE